MDSSSTSSSDRRATTWHSLARRVLTIVAVVLLLDVVVGRALLWGHAHVHTGALLGASNAAQHARADVLVLGSSRALRHYDDRALSERWGAPVWNAGADGRGLYYARGILLLAAAAHRPRLVIVDVSHFENDRATVSVLAPFYGHDPELDRLLVHGDWRNRVMLASRMFRFNGALLAMVSQWNRPWPASGFEPLDRTLTEDALLPAPAAPRPAEPDFEAQIEHTVTLARARGAQISFVESPTLVEALPPAVLAQYQRVATRNGVPFVHFTTASHPELARHELWADAGHLNRGGARLFSELVAEALAPLLR